jgi:lysophospholipid hydrolase
VRVFGFLEKPVCKFILAGGMNEVTLSQVFHELARHLQTRRLIAGDSISLDQDKSFYCVVDGTVQLFARTGQQNEDNRGGSWDNEDMNGYQLLNEVGTGGTLSSLFTILSLFTENVKISWQDDEVSDIRRDDDLDSVTGSQRSSARPPVRVRPRRSDSDVSTMHLDMTASQYRSSPEVMSPRSRGRATSVSSSGSTVHPVGAFSPPRSRSVSQAPSYSGFSTASTETASARRQPAPGTGGHGSYGVVARATEDSTLAVIPAEAFRRLTKKFPKATAHIVQGALDYV